MDENPYQSPEAGAPPSTWEPSPSLAIAVRLVVYGGLLLLGFVTVLFLILAHQMNP